MADDGTYLRDELYERVRGDDALFDFLQDGSLDGLWFWDVTRPENEWYSPRFKELFGYEDHEIANDASWWQQNIHPDDLAVALDNFVAHLEDPDHPYDQIVRYRHRQGNWVWVRCRGIAIRDEDGAPLRLLGAHTDVTELKRVEQALERSNEVLRQFAATIAHDLKAPLAQVNGYATLLQGLGGTTVPGPDGDVDIAGKVVDGVGRAVRMIDDLAGFATAASGAGMATRIDVPAAVHEVLRMLDERVAAADAVVDVGEVPPVLASPTALRHVLLNLLDNALKYARPGTPARIEVRGSHDAVGQVVVEVRDNGRGIDADHREAVLHLGRRGPRAGDVDGAGVGLSSCGILLAADGGTIELDGHDDGSSGTVVRCTLPAAPAEPPTEPGRAVPVAPRVVLFDAAAADLSQLPTALSTRGVDVVDAPGDLVGVFSLLEEGRADVVVTDHRMPDVDGISVASRVRRGWPSARVVLVSGDVDDALRTACRDVGAEGPIAAGDVDGLVRQVQHDV